MKIAGRVEGLQGIKLATYQYIQDHKQKLMSRLSYVLLQHIVKIYQTNQYLQLALVGSQAIAQRYIADAIELFMQEVIEGKPRSNIGYLKKEQGDESKLETKIKQIEAEVMSLREKNKDLNYQLARQAKKAQRALQKYNILSELTIDISHRNKSDLALLKNKYELKIQQLQAKNSQLKENVIKLDTLLEIYRKGTIIPQYCLEKYGQTTTEKQRRLSYQTFPIHSQQIYNPSPSKDRKTLSINSFVINQSFTPAKHFLQYQNQNHIKVEPLLRTDASTQTQALIVPQKMFKNQSTQGQVDFALVEISTPCQEGIKQEEPSCFDFCMENSTKHQQLESEVKILKILNQAYEKQSKQARRQATTLKSEKVQLIHICNRFQDEIDIFKGCISNLELKIEQQNQQIINIQQQKQQLAILFNQLQSNFNNQTQKHSHSHHLIKQKSQGRLTQTEQSSSNTPINNARQSCEPQGLLTAPDQSSSFLHSQQHIAKEVISRYLLEMLDQKCRGETKIILIDQIGECLGWNAEDYRRVQFYKRRVRLKEELPRRKEAEELNIEDRLFRFLRSECGQD